MGCYLWIIRYVNKDALIIVKRLKKNGTHLFSDCLLYVSASYGTSCFCLMFKLYRMI